MQADPENIEHFPRGRFYGYWNGSPAENAAVGIPVFSEAAPERG
jgi:hypothetical protein